MSEDSIFTRFSGFFIDYACLVRIFVNFNDVVYKIDGQFIDE